MKATKLEIPEVVLFEPRVFADDRGAFFESFSAKAFEEATGLKRDFVQDNHSVSSKSVLRGLHYQVPPFAQGKLVRVVKGEVFDVAVDIRKSSPTFGKWVGARLSGDNRHQLWVPEGFAHGFIALTDGAEFLYKTTNFYSSDSERCIAWNDPDIGIDWCGETRPLLSPKDQLGKAFTDADMFD